MSQVIQRHMMHADNLDKVDQSSLVLQVSQLLILVNAVCWLYAFMLNRGYGFDVICVCAYRIQILRVQC